MKLHIKKGDNVYVLAGQSRGQPARLLEVQASQQPANVEGVNIVPKATQPSAKHPQGGLVKVEAPIHISNLALIDPKSGKPTRIGIRKEGDKTVRFSKKSGEEIK